MDKLTEAAINMGKEHGQKQGQMLVDLAIQDIGCEQILKGYRESNEDVMSLCPDPLSGEWAGDPTPVSVIDELAALQVSDELLANANIDDAMAQSESVLDSYEGAFINAFWKVVIDHCEKRLHSANS